MLKRAEGHAGRVRHGDRHARAARDHRAEHRLPDGRRQRVLLRLREEHPADGSRSSARTQSTRLLNFRRGGYDVYTTLDLDLQNAAESAIGAERAADLSRLGRRRRDLERAGRHRPGARHGAEPHVQPGPGGAADRPAVHEHQLQHRLSATAARAASSPGPRTRCSRSREWLKEGHGLSERVDSKPKSQLGRLPGQLPRARTTRATGTRATTPTSPAATTARSNRRSARSTPASSAWRSSSTSAASGRPPRLSACIAPTAIRSCRVPRR